jgi:hypothetical protein
MGYYIIYRIVINMPLEEDPEYLIDQIGVSEEPEEEQSGSV